MPTDDETQKAVEATRERRKQAAQKGREKSQGETPTQPEPEQQPEPTES